MASIRQRQKADGSTVFHVQVRQAGFPARTATFPTRRLAERWGKTIEAQMIEGRHFRHSESRRRTVAEAIDRYVTEEIPKKRDGSMHRVRLPWWKQQIGNVKLADVTPALLAEMREKLKTQPYVRAKPNSKRTTVPAGQKATEYRRSDGTVNRFLAVLSHVFTVARKEWHWVEHNPFDGVSKLRESRGRVRCLDAKERAALLLETSKNPTLHTFVMLALTTACRAGELLKLTWRDIDLKVGRLLFRQTKNDEPRTTWVRGDALQLLVDHAKVRSIDSDQRVFQSATGNATYDYITPFNAAVAAAKLRDFRFHDLRHSAATYLAQAGATEAQLRAVGGWKSGMVRKYVHLAAADAKAALLMLTPQQQQAVEDAMDRCRIVKPQGTNVHAHEESRGPGESSECRGLPDWPTIKQSGGAADAIPPITDTDVANAVRLVARYGRDIRFTPERGWLEYDTRRWATDEKVAECLRLWDAHLPNGLAGVRNRSFRPILFPCSECTGPTTFPNLFTSISAEPPGTLWVKLKNRFVDGRLVNTRSTIDVSRDGVVTPRAAKR